MQFRNKNENKVINCDSESKDKMNMGGGMNGKYDSGKSG